MVRRRSLLATVMAVALLCTGLVGVAAQEATPAAATFADTMGLPELRCGPPTPPMKACQRRRRPVATC